MANTPIITFDYGPPPSHRPLNKILTHLDASPYSRKLRTLLACTAISFRRSEQPVVLPRPILEKLDITHRRIPLLAIGKDIYCDTALSISILQNRYHALRTTPADAAYEAFGVGMTRSCRRPSAVGNVITNNAVRRPSYKLS
jgi:hypothetical protein